MYRAYTTLALPLNSHAGWHKEVSVLLSFVRSGRRSINTFNIVPSTSVFIEQSQGHHPGITSWRNRAELTTPAIDQLQVANVHTLQHMPNTVHAEDTKEPQEGFLLLRIKHPGES